MRLNKQLDLGPTSFDSIAARLHGACYMLAGASWLVKVQLYA